MWIDPETDNYVIEYLVFINEQPAGLPIDHVSTLENSFSFWEKYLFNTSDGKNAIARFDNTAVKGKLMFGLHGLYEIWVKVFLVTLI